MNLPGEPKAVKTIRANREGRVSSKKPWQVLERIVADLEKILGPNAKVYSGSLTDKDTGKSRQIDVLERVRAPEVSSVFLLGRQPLSQGVFYRIHQGNAVSTLDFLGADK